MPPDRLAAGPARKPSRGDASGIVSPCGQRLTPGHIDAVLWPFIDRVVETWAADWLSRWSTTVTGSSHGGSAARTSGQGGRSLAGPFHLASVSRSSSRPRHCSWPSGRLDLDAPIRAYLPGLSGPTSERMRSRRGRC